MHEYIHSVKYYETDKMGITHHSNYIRWMEEARIDFMSAIGLDYASMESMGIYSPVTAVECKYVSPTTFPEEIKIAVSVEEFKGIKLKIKYVMSNSVGKTVCESHSEHCFLNNQGKIVMLKKEYPDIYQAFNNLVETKAQP